ATTVEEAEGELVTAIVDVVENGTIALRRILRGEKEDIGLELDLAVAIARRQIKVDDDAIANVVRIDREAGDADDFLVRAVVAERLAACEGLTLEDGQGHQSGSGLGSAQQQGEKDGQRSVRHVGVLFQWGGHGRNEALSYPTESRRGAKKDAFPT